MLATCLPYVDAQPIVITSLPVITTRVRQLDEKLWDLLSRPGPLTAEEWAYIEQQERAGQLEAGSGE